MTKKILYFTAIFLASYFFSSPAFAQRFNIESYNTREGLSQSQVTFIVQDDDGFMWFGTRDGISRFDGKKITIFYKNQGLTGTDVSAGLKDSKGNIWFGFINGTISIYNIKSKKFEAFRHLPDIQQLCRILKIMEDSQGVIWIATDGCGLIAYDGEKARHITKSSGLTYNVIIDVCQIKQNVLSVVDGDGIHFYRRDSLVNGVVKEAALTLPREIDLKSVITCAIDPDFKQGWFATTNNGTYLVDLTNHKILDHLTAKDGFSESLINVIYKDKQDNVWFVDNYGKLICFRNARSAEKGGRIWIPDAITGLTEKRVWTIFQDREENYWIGTDGGGVLKYRDKSILLISSKEGLAGNSVWTILKSSSGDLWLGTNASLTRIYKKNGKTRVKNYTSFVNQAFKYVNNLYEDKNKDIWFYAAEVGLFKWQRKSQRIVKVRLPDYFNASYASHVAEDAEGNIWISSFFKDGLLKYNIKTKTYRHLTVQSDSLLSDTYRFIYKDRNNDLWFATALQGLMHLKDGKWIKYSTNKGCPIYTAISMTQDSDGNFWFITVQNKIFKFDGKQFTNLTTSKGLHGLGFYSIIADGNTIWVGTSRGIARYNPADSSFIQFGYQEGYPINETNESAVFRDDDGYMWFGTIDGAVAFNPGKVKKNRVAPKVQITGLQIFFKDHPFPPDQQFDPDNNHLTFYFSGLSFTKPELVRYKYILEGFDADWSPQTDIAKATYSNLPPGDYRFKVKASNGEGVWTEVPAQYAFTILTPFWMTWWFIVLILLVISLLIFITVKIRIRAIEKQRSFLEQKVRERTKELLKEKEEVEKAMKALHESETKFRSYTQLASSAIYIHQDDRFKFVNKAGEIISGYSLEELQQMNIWKLLHPDDFDMVMGHFKTRLSGGVAPERYEFRIITKQKEIKWLDFSGRIIEYEGKPAVLATVFDITERKKVEQALLEEKERLDVTLSSIGDGVITTSIDGRIAIFNKMAGEVTGWSQEEAQGKSIEEVFVIRDTEHNNTIINPVKELQNSGALTSEDKIVYLERKGSGSTRIISYNSVPLKDQNSNMVGAVIAFRDITEKRQMEEELFKAQKLESIGLLAGGIAHDFNNILTAIMGNISLAKMHQETSDKVIDLLDKAENATSRAQDLTQQLLTFSKGGTPVLKTSSVESVIEESVDFVLKGSNVKCVLDMQDDIKAVEIDEGQISQVIQNLVINADQAMPEGGTIFISVKNVQIKKNKSLPLPPGEYVRIDVKDEGIGIQKEHLTKIFDPFFSTKQTGSGLGLATSYSILQKHNGFLGVKSEIGKGSTFSIYLPASQKKKRKVRGEVIDSRQFLGKGRILIMDDDEMILETSRALLSHLGFEVDYATDGKTALEKYRQVSRNGGKYDLVIMDLTIPGGMGGKQAIEKLLEFDPQATAIVSSGYSTDPIMADFKKYGFKGRLKKPFNMKEILEVLETLNLIQIKN